MDDSSVGKKKDYKSFQRVLYNLDMALKTIVNGKKIDSSSGKRINFWMVDYYRGFNNSIGTFGGVVQYINGTINDNTQQTFY